MEQLGKDLEKVLKAGIGAVKSGVEHSQDLIDNWAEKGEPIYEAAKASVCATADKIKKHMECCPKQEENDHPLSIDRIKSALQGMHKEELDDILAFIGQIYMDEKMKKSHEGAGEKDHAAHQRQSVLPSPAPHP